MAGPAQCRDDLGGLCTGKERIMRNNNNNSMKAKLQSFASGVRTKAEVLRSNKETIASAALEGAQQGVSSFGEFVDALEAVASIYRSVQQVCVAVSEDKGVRTKVTTLIANAVGDLSTRLNEFSGVIEYISTSETLAGEFEKLQKNIKIVDKKFKSRKRKFTVVDSDEDDGTTH